MISRIADQRPYTAKISCPKCRRQVEYWWTSGMSECYPHFYCDTCSNVIHREVDHDMLRPDDADVLRLIPQIVASLPRCRCGGRYTLEAEPKCPHCRYEFKRDNWRPETRAMDPHAILIEGAEMLSEP